MFINYLPGPSLRMQIQMSLAMATACWILAVPGGVGFLRQTLAYFSQPTETCSAFQELVKELLTLNCVWKLSLKAWFESKCDIIFFSFFIWYSPFLSLCMLRQCPFLWILIVFFKHARLWQVLSVLHMLVYTFNSRWRSCTIF